MMSVIDCISELISSSGEIFETDQEIVVSSILRSEKVVFLDTCFITRSFHVEMEDLLTAFEQMAGGRDVKKIVFVITELVLYELKDSRTNVLQEKNKNFLEKISEYGFRLFVLKEETVCEKIKPFMGYSNKEWNKRFATLIHDNIANLSFIKLVKTDSRMPYFGFSDIGYNIPDSSSFIRDIITYLKNEKRNKDSLAEELICTSLFSIFELTRGSMRSEYIFCTHDFGAVARMNKAIQTSYPVMQKKLKTINMFTMIQYMVEQKIITSKENTLIAAKNIMGDHVKLIIRNELPFSSVEKTITIEDAIEKMFNNESVELVGRGI